MNPLYEELIAKDKQYIWHPFTQMQEYRRSTPVLIDRGRGVKLIDIDGNEYYDGVSSLWLNVHGHRVEKIDTAIREQLEKIAHSTLLGLANGPSAVLAEKLIRLAPRGLAKVFYSDSGSEAVEIGLKIAYQYWRLCAPPGRRSFIAMTNAYHGDTIGATSVGGIDLFHATYRDLLFHVHRVPYPYPYRFDGSTTDCAAHCLEALDRVLERHGNEIAGLIVEPMVQGAAGMIMMPGGFMKQVEQRCRQYGILLLVDEVATGFGRTGAMFACEHEGVCPDIMMLAKGITGGYLPLAATLTTDTIYNAFLGDYSEKKTFFHGHSYTGNPLACAAAIASLELFAEHDLISDVKRKAALIANALEKIGRRRHVGDVRVCGLMVGVELVQDKASKESYPWEVQMGIRVCNRSRELGMILRPLGNVIVFMPPLASSDAELAAMVAILDRAIAEITER